MRDDILVWCDIETMNLEPSAPMLELGFRVTDLDGNLIDKQSWLVWDIGHQIYWTDRAPEIVKKMHTDNYLLHEAKEAGNSRLDVSAWATKWLVDKGFDGQPLAGSSVHSDRAWLGTQMPRLLKCFHYRIIDNSSIKELCRRLNPPVYAALPDKQEKHRVDPDLVDSVDEYKFYLDNFLWDGRF